jgi:antitoxin CptB
MTAIDQPTDQLATDELELRRRRALYRAEHRGTKEMDWLLGRYAKAKLADMDAAALAHFEQLIAVIDVDLQNWLMKPGVTADPAFAAIIADIRAFHALTEKTR